MRNTHGGAHIPAAATFEFIGYLIDVCTVVTQRLDEHLALSFKSMEQEICHQSLDRFNSEIQILTVRHRLHWARNIRQRCPEHAMLLRDKREDRLISIGKETTPPAETLSLMPFLFLRLPHILIVLE